MTIDNKIKDEKLQYSILPEKRGKKYQSIHVKKY